jgi:hypothetical protein
MWPCDWSAAQRSTLSLILRNSLGGKFLGGKKRSSLFARCVGEEEKRFITLTTKKRF